MERLQKVFRITTNVAAADAAIHRVILSDSPVAEKDILLFGMQYSVRYLQSGFPSVVPFIGVGFSTHRLESELWNASTDVSHYGMLHIDTYDTLPLKDMIEFPGGPIEIQANEQINGALYVDNLSGAAAFTTTLRLHVTFYYMYKAEYERQEGLKWQRILNTLR